MDDFEYTCDLSVKEYQEYLEWLAKKEKAPE